MTKEKTVTIYVDKDILDWFKDQSEDYLTHINAVLRAYMIEQE